MLADAARVVAANYRDSDAMAAATLEAAQVLNYIAKTGPAVESEAITGPTTSTPGTVESGPTYG